MVMTKDGGGGGGGVCQCVNVTASPSHRKLAKWLYLIRRIEAS